MNTFLTNFSKGLFIGFLLLPFEFLFLSLKTNQQVLAQDLREEIRSQIADPREIRGEIPCEDGRVGCGRPIPRESYQPKPSGEPTPPPSAPPIPSPSPVTPPPSEETPPPGVGGPSPSPEEEEEGEAAEEKVEIIEVIKVLPVTSGD